MGSPPPDVTTLLAALTFELERRGLRFMLIGGQAVLLHGLPRFTADVDVTLAAGPAALGELRSVCDALGLSPLTPSADELESFARRTNVLRLFAGRPRDLEDAEGIVRRQAAALDWAYLERWVAEFAQVPGREGMPAALVRLETLAG